MLSLFDYVQFYPNFQKWILFNLKYTTIQMF